MFGSGAVAVGLAAPVTGLFVPNVYEIRNRYGTVNPFELRLGVAMGGAIALGIGLAGSAATRSPAPFFGALLGVAIVAGIYEWALRNPAGA